MGRAAAGNATPPSCLGTAAAPPAAFVSTACSRCLAAGESCDTTLLNDAAQRAVPRCDSSLTARSVRAGLGVPAGDAVPISRGRRRAIREALAGSPAPDGADVAATKPSLSVSATACMDEGEGGSQTLFGSRKGFRGCKVRQAVDVADPAYNLHMLYSPNHPSACVTPTCRHMLTTPTWVCASSRDSALPLCMSSCTDVAAGGSAATTQR